MTLTLRLCSRRCESIPDSPIVELHADDLPPGVRLIVQDATGHELDLVFHFNVLTGEVQRALAWNMPPFTGYYPAPLVMRLKSGPVIRTWRDLWIAGETAAGIDRDAWRHRVGLEACRQAFREAAGRSGLNGRQWQARLDATPDHPDRFRHLPGVLQPV